MDLWIYYGYNLWIYGYIMDITGIYVDLCILNPTGGMMFPSIISIS